MQFVEAAVADLRVSINLSEEQAKEKEIGAAAQSSTSAPSTKKEEEGWFSECCGDGETRRKNGTKTIVDARKLDQNEIESENEMPKEDETVAADAVQ